MLYIRYIILLLLVLPSGVYACLNGYHPVTIPLDGNKIDLNALLHDKGDQFAYWRGFSGDSEEALSKMDSNNKIGWNKLDLIGKTEHAGLVLRFGDKMEALKRFEELYAEQPNDYAVLASLGTAYELTGNDAKALELLRKAVAINPRSHYGSEWIHIRILEEKLGAKQYDKIINLDIKDYGQWIVDKDYVFVRNPDSLKFQLAYQLHERIGFIRPTDPIIGQLVLDFADLVAKTETRREAVPFYDFASQYEPTLRPVVVARHEAIVAEQKEVQGTFRWASVVWAIPLLAFFLILFSWIKVMRKQKKEAGQR